MRDVGSKKKKSYSGDLLGFFLGRLAAIHVIWQFVHALIHEPKSQHMPKWKHQSLQNGASTITMVYYAMYLPLTELARHCANAFSYGNFSNVNTFWTFARAHHSKWSPCKAFLRVFFTNSRAENTRSSATLPLIVINNWASTRNSPIDPRACVDSLIELRNRASWIALLLTESTPPLSCAHERTLWRHAWVPSCPKLLQLSMHNVDRDFTIPVFLKWITRVGLPLPSLFFPIIRVGISALV